MKSYNFKYLSDYVFDGKNPPYKLDSVPNPINKYGISKFYGEKVTSKASNSKKLNFICHFLIRKNK